MVKTKFTWPVILLLWAALGCIAPIFNREDHFPALEGPGIVQLKLAVEPNYTSVRWSPDGARLAATYVIPSSSDVPMPSESSIYQIQIIDVNDSSVKVIEESHPGLREVLAWLSDDQIAFYGNDDLNNGTWLIHADGTGNKEMVIGNVAASWNADGKRIAYWVPDQQSVNKTRFIGVQNLETTALQEVFRYQEKYVIKSRLDWSPDGTHILFAFGASSISYEEIPASDIYSMDLTSGIATILTSGGYHGSVTWSPDQELVAYSYQERRTLPGQEALYVMNSDGSCPIQLTDPGSNYGELGSLSWSPDGRYIAFIWNWNIYLLDTYEVPGIESLKNSSTCSAGFIDPVN